MSPEPKSDITFEEPSGGPAYDWAAIAEKLRAAPGEWAKVFDRDKTSYAETIRMQDIKALLPTEAGIFELKTRNNERLRDEDGRERRFCTLYLRYVPTKQSVKAATKRSRKR